MLPALASLIAIQQLDSAAEAARRRLGEMPAAEQELERRVATASESVTAAKARMAENQTARRELEKQVAEYDRRLAKFDEHKAAVKTNHEYTALLHEISTAKSEKDSVEEQILMLLEAADAITADVKGAEAAVADAKRERDATRVELDRERKTLDEELLRLSGARAGEIRGVEATVLARYDQLLKQRRMVAVAQINGDLCTACHVRLRPAVAQLIRRNDEIIYCDSCQRILYYVPKDGQA